MTALTAAVVSNRLPSVGAFRLRKFLANVSYRLPTAKQEENKRLKWTNLNFKP